MRRFRCTLIDVSHTFDMARISFDACHSTVTHSHNVYQRLTLEALLFRFFEIDAEPSRLQITSAAAAAGGGWFDASSAARLIGRKSTVRDDFSAVDEPLVPTPITCDPDADDKSTARRAWWIAMRGNERSPLTSDGCCNRERNNATPAAWAHALEWRTIWTVTLLLFW